jgi:hypothetical protein
MSEHEEYQSLISNNVSEPLISNEKVVGEESVNTTKLSIEIHADIHDMVNPDIQTILMLILKYMDSKKH